MTKKRETDSTESRLAEWEEWQRHQYDPGHYVGGVRKHPLYNRRSMPKMYGWFLVIGPGLFLALMVTVVVVSLLEGTPADIAGILPLGGGLLLLLLLGLRLVRSGRR